MLPQRRDQQQILEGGIRDRIEGTEVSTSKADIFHQPGGGGMVHIQIAHSQ